METRRTRSKANGTKNEDVLILEESIMVVEQKTNPELITLEDDDISEVKTKKEPIDLDVECLQDVITLDDDDVLCVDELKREITMTSASTDSKGSQKPPVKETTETEKGASGMLTRRQRALRGAELGRDDTGSSNENSPARSPAIPSRNQNNEESSVLTRRQGALAKNTSSVESSPNRATPQQNKVDFEPTTKEPAECSAKDKAMEELVKDKVARRVEIHARAKVKQEPKTEPELTSATFWGPHIAGVMVPKSETTATSSSSEDRISVVVKTQPPEQDGMDVDTPEAPSSRLTAASSEREDDDEEEVEAGPEHIRRLFIGGVAYQTTMDSLRRYFERWGKIVDIFLPMDRITKRTRGFAFVTFTKSSMVDAVQKARPHTVDGRVVKPKRAVPRSESHSPQAKLTVKTAFVHGLKGLFSEQDLEEYFKSFGKVVSCKVFKQRGFGFVQFDDYDPVDRIFLQKVHKIQGQLIGAAKALGRGQQTAARNRWRTNGFGRWTGMNPRGNQFSRRPDTYWQNRSNFVNSYQSRLGGGPVRNYYSRRYAPYSSWSTNPNVGYSTNHNTNYSNVVVNWSSNNAARRNVSDSSSWARQGISSYSTSQNPSYSTNRNLTFSSVFSIPFLRSSQTHYYTSLRS